MSIANGVQVMPYCSASGSLGPVASHKEFAGAPRASRKAARTMNKFVVGLRVPLRDPFLFFITLKCQKVVVAFTWMLSPESRAMICSSGRGLRIALAQPMGYLGDNQQKIVRAQVEGRDADV